MAISEPKTLNGTAWHADGSSSSDSPTQGGGSTTFIDKCNCKCKCLLNGVEISDGSTSVDCSLLQSTGTECEQACEDAGLFDRCKNAPVTSGPLIPIDAPVPSSVLPLC
jgi:hypothetical protein